MESSHESSTTSVTSTGSVWEQQVSQNVAATRAFSQRKYKRAVELFTEAYQTSVDAQADFTHRAMIMVSRGLGPFRVAALPFAPSISCDADPPSVSPCATSQPPAPRGVQTLLRAAAARLNAQFWILIHDLPRRRATVHARSCGSAARLLMPMLLRTRKRPPGCAT